MNEIPGDLKFLKSHEWARIEDNGHITVGISDHAQAALGDLVYVELPGVGDDLQAGNGAAVVESVKAASDIAEVILAAATAEDPLTMICMFSSIAARRIRVRRSALCSSQRASYPLMAGTSGARDTAPRLPFAGTHRYPAMRPTPLPAGTVWAMVGQR